MLAALLLSTYHLVHTLRLMVSVEGHQGLAFHNSKSIISRIVNRIPFELPFRQPRRFL